MDVSGDYMKYLPRLQEWCAEAERCPSDLRRKLIRMKLSGSDYYEQLLPVLEKGGFIQSDRYIISYIDKYSRVKKWGKAKIQKSLMAKGLTARPEHFEMAGFSNDEDKERLQHILQRKLSGMRESDRHKRKIKLIRFGLSRGFSMQDIQSVIPFINL